jgi:competence protein ComEC
MLPFCWLALSFAAGSVLVHFFPACAQVLISSLFVFFPALFVLKNHKYFMPVLLIVIFLFGTAFGHYDRTKPSPDIEKRMTFLDLERPIVLFGKVASEPEIKTKGRKVTVSFVLEASRIGRRKTEGKVQVFLFQPGTAPQIEDEIRLWGKIKPVPAAVNPAQFDYQKYLKEKDITLLMNVYGAGSVRLLKPGSSWSFCRAVANTRKQIGIAIDSLFRESDRVFIKALILGERKNLDPQWKNDFMKTGTSHLLAISGLNIALAAGSFYILMIAAGLSQKTAALFALIATVFQVFIAGLGIPVQRAGIMACFGFLALLLERERNGLNIFFFSFLVLLVLDTRSLFNISFQLSFLSLFCLIVFAQHWKGRWPWLEAFASSAAVMAGTLPIVIYHFNVFAPISILANLMAIPFFHLTLFSALLALVTGFLPVLPDLFAGLSHYFLHAGLVWIHFCSKPHWGYQFLLKPAGFHMVFYYFSLGLFLLLNRGTKRLRALKWTSLFFWIISFGLLFRPLKSGGFEMTCFAAGSNEIMHLQFEDGSHWLINSGRSLPSDQAEWIIAPYLRSKGIKKLKGIIFTDYLKRHTAGFETLKRNFEFEYVIGPYFYKEKAMLPASGLRQLRKKDRILIPDGSIIEVLDHYQARFTLGLTHGSHKFLIFPNDTISLSKKYEDEGWHTVSGQIVKERAVIYKIEGAELIAIPFKG